MASVGGGATVLPAPRAESCSSVPGLTFRDPHSVLTTKPHENMPTHTCDVPCCVSFHIGPGLGGDSAESNKLDPRGEPGAEPGNWRLLPSCARRLSLPPELTV